MVKYSKDLSHFHQKSWKTVKKEQYQQDGHSLEKMKNPEDAFIPLFLLAVNMNSFDFAAVFIGATSCSDPSPRSHKSLQKTLVEVPSQSILQGRAVARGRDVKRPAELPKSFHGQGNQEGNQFTGCLQKPP